MEDLTLEKVENRIQEDSTYNPIEDIWSLIDTYKQGDYFECSDDYTRRIICNTVDCNLFYLRLGGPTNISGYISHKGKYIDFKKKMIPNYYHLKQFENHDVVKLVLELLNIIKFHKHLDITRKLYERQIHDDLNVIIDYLDNKHVDKEKLLILENYFEMLKTYNAASILLMLKIGKRYKVPETDEKTSFVMHLIYNYLNKIRNKLSNFEKTVLITVTRELSWLNNQAYLNKMIENREIV